MDFDNIKIGNVKVAIDPKAMSKKMLSVMRSGDYEREEAGQITTIIQPGDRIVELGGGVGYVSSVAGMLGKAQDIVVYEANPDLIPLIERTHQLNNVTSTVINAVVLPRKSSDTVPFYIRDDFWASSLSADTYGYSAVKDVPVVSFGEMLRRHNPTMLIVDIEGGEGELFQDVELTGIRKIYIEIHQAILGRVGMKRLFDFFSSRDFHYDQWHSTHGVILFSHVLR